MKHVYRQAPFERLQVSVHNLPSERVRNRANRPEVKQRRMQSVNQGERWLKEGDCRPLSEKASSIKWLGLLYGLACHDPLASSECRSTGARKVI